MEARIVFLNIRGWLQVSEPTTPERSSIANIHGSEGNMTRFVRLYGVCGTLLNAYAVQQQEHLRRKSKKKLDGYTSHRHSNSLDQVGCQSPFSSFGAMLYEMATGHKAFEAKSHASLIAAILKEEPRPMRELQPLTPPALEHIVKACLAKDPDERPQSAHDLKLQLEWIRESSGISQSQMAQTGPTTAHPHPGARPRASSWLLQRARFSWLARLPTLSGRSLLLRTAWNSPFRCRKK